MAGTRKKASLYVRLSKEAKTNLSLTGMMEDVRYRAEELRWSEPLSHRSGAHAGRRARGRKGERVTYHFPSDAEEQALLADNLCVWCKTLMDEDKVFFNGRITSSTRCRQARYRARRKGGLTD